MQEGLTTRRRVQGDLLLDDEFLGAAKYHTCVLRLDHVGQCAAIQTLEPNTGPEWIRHAQGQRSSALTIPFL